MRIHHLAVGAAAGAALFAGAAPAFAGVGMGQVLVSPSTATAGQIVHITGTCPNNGGMLQWVGSSAFAAKGDHDAYKAMTGQGGSATMTSTNPMNWAGWATIAANVRPGAVTVAARCGATTIKVQITIVLKTKTTMKTMVKPTMRATMKATPTMTAMPTSTMSAGTGTMTVTPTATTGQVGMMPSGAPNTGLASSVIPGGYATEGAAGGVLFGAGIAGLMLRRRARARR